MHDAGSTKLLCNLPDHDERYHERRLLQPLATAVVRPGGGVYTQKPFLAVSVNFYTFGIAPCQTMRFWHGRVEFLGR